MTDADFAQATPTFEHALPIGTTLSDGQFTVTDHLGSGGFGITYRARDNVLGRTIVIKECFPEEFCRRTDINVTVHNRAYAEPFRNIVTMFMREARSLAQLRHPNIVGVHGAFEENQTAYMALDLIEGLDLHEIMATGELVLSPHRIRIILGQMLDAIEKIHAIDLLHRDISPDNIMIEHSGTPVLIDFGAARADASRRTRALSSLLVVKDGYSPQEFYVAGSEQTQCSDLYALAATFYHLISGQAPVHSQSRLIEIAAGKADPCKPLAGRIQGYDTAFLEAIDQAMKVHPSDRLQTVGKWKSIIADTATQPDAFGGHAGGSHSNSEVDLNLERSLARLVKETNVEVQKLQQLKAPPKPTPSPVERPSKANWVEDFNRTTSNPAPTAATKRASPKVSPAPHGQTTQASGLKVTSKDTDWIDKAKAKQERVRSEQEQALELQNSAALWSTNSEMSRSPSENGGETGSVRVPSRTVPTQRQVTARLVAGLFICCSAVFVVKSLDLTPKQNKEVAVTAPEQTEIKQDDVLAHSEASPPPAAPDTPTPPRVIQLGNNGGVRWHAVPN